MPARPKGQPPTVTLICPVGDHPFTVPYKNRTRRFCSHQHANAYHGARRGDAPKGYATIAMLAVRYGYSRAHIERLVGGGLVEAEFRDGHYLISTADSLGRFVEANDNNNTAWVKFALSYVNGTPKIQELETSPCAGVMCGVRNGPRSP